MLDVTSSNPEAPTRTTAETDPPSEFERAASERPAKGLVSDFWAFLLQNKKWWMLPILVILLLFGALVSLSGTALAPFIYSLF
jgi:hypothetical protein